MTSVPHVNRARLRRRLADDPPLRGAFVKLAGLEPIDALAVAGADFGVVDLEHAALDERTVLDQVAYAAARGLPLLVRLADHDVGRAGRLLDAGAAGIQLADVRDADQARGLVRACRYPPDGDRGVSPSQRDAGYGSRTLGDLLDDGAAAPLVVAQIERDLAEPVLEQIAGSGVDVLFVGPVDLTARLWELEEGERRRRVAALMDRTSAAARRAGSVFGHHGPRDGENGRFVTAASDIGALVDGLRRAIEAAR